MNIKNIIKLIVMIIIAFLISAIIILSIKLKNTKGQLQIANNNVEAFILESDSLKNKVRSFQFTIEQLDYLNDSLVKSIRQVQKELKIKDKNILQLQGLISKQNKIDTIIVSDTIFREDFIKLDTTLQDQWYKLNLELEYPNKIIVNPEFKNEQYTIVSYKKVTVNTPKKCAFLRFFQKKKKVVEVEVVNKNPYVIIQNQKFIEVIK